MYIPGFAYLFISQRTLRFISVHFSLSVVSNSFRPHESQHARPPCPSPTPGPDSNSCPSSRWCHPTISSSAIPFSSCPHLSQHQGLFQWVNSSHQVAKVLEFQLQHQSFQWTPRTDLLWDELVGCPCSPKDSQVTLTFLLLWILLLWIYLHRYLFKTTFSFLN